MTKVFKTPKLRDILITGRIIRPYLSSHPHPPPSFNKRLSKTENTKTRYKCYCPRIGAIRILRYRRANGSRTRHDRRVYARYHTFSRFFFQVTNSRSTRPWCHCRWRRTAEKTWPCGPGARGPTCSSGVSNKTYYL